ncbi:FecR/PupR family sigma factor regulator, partial [Pseudomonas aeruginosa]|uniref:FecR/PupR family sigma factor regulator n=1 Tax=Pseudomonas aeruginosa TaxID=287 RepID=UPI003978B49C
MNAADEGRIPSPILDEAAEWLVRLQDSGCTDDTRQACAQWRQRSPQHAHAWERAERLLLTPVFYVLIRRFVENR